MRRGTSADAALVRRIVEGGGTKALGTKFLCEGEALDRAVELEKISKSEFQVFFDIILQNFQPLRFRETGGGSQMGVVLNLMILGALLVVVLWLATWVVSRLRGGQLRQKFRKMPLEELRGCMPAMDGFVHAGTMDFYGVKARTWLEVYLARAFGPEADFDANWSPAVQSYIGYLKCLESVLGGWGPWEDGIGPRHPRTLTGAPGTDAQLRLLPLEKTLNWLHDTVVLQRQLAVENHKDGCRWYWNDMILSTESSFTQYSAGMTQRTQQHLKVTCSPEAVRREILRLEGDESICGQCTGDLSPGDPFCSQCGARLT